MEPFDVLAIRKRLGKDSWSKPYEFVAHQWVFDSRWSNTRRIIVSSAPWVTLGNEEMVDWLHASISGNKLPTYDDLKMLHEAVFDTGWAYQVFAPPHRHINIHANALHLWGRVDGKPQLPDFQEQGGLNSI